MCSRSISASRAGTKPARLPHYSKSRRSQGNLALQPSPAQSVVVWQRILQPRHDDEQEHRADRGESEGDQIGHVRGHVG